MKGRVRKGRTEGSVVERESVCKPFPHSSQAKYNNVLCVAENN